MRWPGLEIGSAELSQFAAGLIQSSCFVLFIYFPSLVINFQTNPEHFPITFARQWQFKMFGFCFLKDEKVQTHRIYLRKDAS